MKTLIYILPFLTFGQSFETNLNDVTCEIVNDTLHVRGGLVQVVKLTNLDTSRGDTLQEIDFAWYMLPLSNIQKGLYSLKIRGYKKDAPTIYFVNKTVYDYKEVDYIEGYEYKLEKPKSSQSGNIQKPRVVQLIHGNDVDYLTKNGRNNILYLWKINNGIKTPINLSYETH